MAPQIIFGDVLQFKDLDALRPVLKKVGITRQDTAAMYDNGKSEHRIGQAKWADDFTIDTKILFTFADGDDHTAENVAKSAENSIKELGVPKVNVLYFHGPDATPVEEQARAMNEQYKAGRFTHFGVSNIDPPTLQAFIDVAEKEGLVKPAVYQGHYNLLSRGYEKELFPLLRKHNMAFNAYSTLGGGFLLGNYTEDGVQAGGRYSMPRLSDIFKHWYDKPPMHAAVRKLRAISQRTGIGMGELSNRWLRYHSVLQDQDGIIIGASKTSQIERTCAELNRGPLDDEVAKEMTAVADHMTDEDFQSMLDLSWALKPKI